MMMYAWSPNWNSNAVGNDHYNLYARRSFDGGVTWTTTPAALGGEGTEYLENYYGDNDRRCQLNRPGLTALGDLSKAAMSPY